MYANRITFGDLLRAHRIIKGISQEELSERCLYFRDRSCISKLERKIRKPSIDTLKILAGGLELKGRQKAIFDLLGRLQYLSRTEDGVLNTVNNGDILYAKTYARTKYLEMRKI